MSAVERPNDEVLFSWIHLSDIHIGHGDASHGWDQKLVLQALRDDIVQMIADRKAPHPHAILVTGDIAFSGATRAKDEYEAARAWLVSLASAVQLGPADVFLVPGNHDVQRNIDVEDKNIGRLVKELRSGEYSLDKALADTADAPLLKKRMANYLDFASSFGPTHGNKRERIQSPLYWRHRINVGSDLEIRLAGLNSALLAADDSDQGKLHLGMAQLAHVFLDPPVDEKTVVILLSHHPFRGRWLADEREVAAWARNHAHIHLSGHVHEADIEQTIAATGDSFIRVVAGAVHAEKNHSGMPLDQAYNFAAIVKGADGRLYLDVWHRRWLNNHKVFRRDADNLPDNAEHSRHEIRDVVFLSAAELNGSSVTHRNLEGAPGESHGANKKQKKPTLWRLLASFFLLSTGIAVTLFIKAQHQPPPEDSSTSSYNSPSREFNLENQFNLIEGHVFMQKHEVTISEYNKYLTSHQLAPHTIPFSKCKLSKDQDIKRWPVTFISSRSAESYCESIGARLPTLNEWETAAGLNGTDREENLKRWNQKIFDKKLRVGTDFSCPENYDAREDDDKSHLNFVGLGGNVAEVAKNSNSIIIIGGAFGLKEPSPESALNTRSPIVFKHTNDKDEKVGFRCVKEEKK